MWEMKKGFLVADTQLYKRLCPSVGWLVGRSVMLELKSRKTRISAPAHPSATDGRVSGLVREALSVGRSVGSLVRRFIRPLVTLELSRLGWCVSVLNGGWMCG